MEGLIKQAFEHHEFRPYVQKGCYDLVGLDGEIILPQVWEKVIEPDVDIIMHMWPFPEHRVPSKPSPSSQSAAKPPPPSIFTAVPIRPGKSKVEPSKGFREWMSAGPKKGRSKKVKG
jgi:hypothetical protein